MLTDDQINSIETAASVFNGDVQQLAFGVREYQRAMREANKETRYNNLIQLQRVSPDAYKRVLATIPESKRAEVMELVSVSSGKELPKPAVSNLSETIKIKPLGGTIKATP